MPASMPYHLETGPTFQLIEDFLNGRDLYQFATAPSQAAVSQHRARLWDLRSKLGAPSGSPGASINAVLTAASGIAAYAGLAGQLASLGNRSPIEALRRDWLGSPVSGKYDHDSKDSAERGKWLNYEGYPEQILRKAFFQAISIAMGVNPSFPLGDPDPGAAMPTGFICMWKCAQPWLEAWIQWRDRPAAVVITICTPSDGSAIALNPGFRPNSSSANFPNYSINPANTRSRGSVVVTHRSHSFTALKSGYTVTWTKAVALSPAGVLVKVSDGAPLPYFGAVYSGVETTAPTYAGGQAASAGAPQLATISPALVDGGVL